MPRVIKKYANRRLYDTEASSYITLDDVKALIINEEDIQIVSAKDETDLTNQVLLQVVGEAENPIMTNFILKNMIRFYHGNQHQPFIEYMEQALKWYQQHPAMGFQDAVQNWVDFSQNQFSNWQKMMGLENV